MEALPSASAINTLPTFPQEGKSLKLERLTDCELMREAGRERAVFMLLGTHISIVASGKV